MRIVLLISFFCLFLYAEAPRLFLLKTYRDDMDVTGWVMSEKLDGVRAYWDGEKLKSRSGRVLSPPHDYTKDFPPFALDGELWSSRGAFEHVVSIVNSKVAHERWNQLSYYIFEVPDQKGGLFDRLNVLEAYMDKHSVEEIKIISQKMIKSKQEVKEYFDEVIKLGGEGIVIRDPKEVYYTGRTNSAFKYKPFMDAECRLVSVIEGKGKLTGQMGAIRCDFEGRIIKIGSGFNADHRRYPPGIGSWISFKYYGLTHLGNPKYPVFLRVRSDKDLSVEK